MYRRTSLFNRPPSNHVLPSVHSLFAPWSLAPCSSLALTAAVSRQKLKMPHQPRLRTCCSCAFPGLLSSPSSLISYGGNRHICSIIFNYAGYKCLLVCELTSIRHLNEWVAIHRSNRRVSPNQFTLPRWVVLESYLVWD